MRTCRGRLLAENNGLRVIDCEVCGFAHLESGGAAEIEYMAGAFQDDTWFEKERQEHVAGLWDSCYEFQWRIMRQTEPFLDFGCGAGWFMWYVRRTSVPMPVECYGAEIAPIPHEYRPVNVKHLIYHPAAPEVNQRFPAVRLSLVLEHIETPRGFLLTHLEFWKPRRILIIVPNEFNPLQRKVGGSWFVSHWHWNYFTPRSLTNLLARFGYRPTFQGASFPMELFILLGFDYRKDEELGKRCHLTRLRLEKRVGWRIFHVYSLLHRLLGWGREMIYLFEIERKPIKIPSTRVPLALA